MLFFSLKLTNTRYHYDFRKYFLAADVNIWNSLPSEVINAPSLNSFKNRRDRFWMNLDILYNWHADLTKTGSKILYPDNLNNRNHYYTKGVLCMRWTHRSFDLVP